MTDDSQISALERLTKLRDTGVLTPEEFELEKAKLLAGPASKSAPFYRRLWFVVLLTCLLVTFPIALIILLTGDVFKRASGALIPIKRTTRRIYAGALVLWLGALIIQAYLHPTSISEAWKASADRDQTASNTTASSPTSPPLACDSSDAADMVKSAIEDSATSGIVATKVMDYGHAKELWFDTDDNARFCQADAELNTGSTPLSFRLYYGPSGTALVEVKQGADAFNVQELKDLVAASKQIAVQKAKQQTSTAPAAAPTQPQPNADTDSTGDPEFDAVVAKLSKAAHAVADSLPDDRKADFTREESDWTTATDQKCSAEANGDANALRNCYMREAEGRLQALSAMQGN